MAKCLQKEISARVRGAFHRRIASETRGQELVEFAMMLPVLFALLMGIFWFGRVVSVYQALGRAAREGARVAVTPTSASLGDVPNDPTAAINSALKAASLDYTQATVTVAPNQTLVASDSPKYDQVSGVTVTITYPLLLHVPLLPGSGVPINLTSVVSMRQEY